MKRPLPNLGKVDLIQDAITYTREAYEEIEDNVISRPISVQNKYFSVSAYFFQLDDLDVLAFKGSVELRDWTVNAQAVPYPYNGRLCHMGFVRAHRSVWPSIKKLLTSERELLITGHSLGGAEAELSAALVTDHKAPVHLITFGKPNVFFCPRRSKMRHLATQLSFVSGSDIVARIPHFLYGPDPAQNMIYMGNDGVDYYNPSKRLRKNDFKVTTFGADHFLDTYLARTNRVIKAQMELNR